MAPLAMCVLDTSGAVIWVNRACARIDSLPRELSELAAATDIKMGDVSERDCEIDGMRWRITVAAIPVLCEPGRLLVTLTPQPCSRTAAPQLAQILSPVELRLVERICAGDNLREASEVLRISYHTARKYMQTVFRKTGARRQADLVAQILSTGAAHGLPAERSLHRPS